MRAFGVVPAAGVGERMGGGVAKQFMDVMGCPILVYTLKALFEANVLSGITVAVRERFVEDAGKTIDGYDLPTDKIAFIPGGKTRQGSVYNALLSLRNNDIDDEDIVLIHDAARPMLDPEIVKRAVKEAEEFGAVVVGTPTTDASVLSEDGIVEGYLPKKRLYLLQTPQAFRYRSILEAHEAALKDATYDAGDDGDLVVRTGGKVKIIPGSRDNIKITYPEDIERFENLLAKKGVVNGSSPQRGN